MIFTEAELKYLASQMLGRLATVDSHGAPQNNPVGFRLNEDLDTIDIGGHNLGASRKFKNVQLNPHVAIVIDDQPSVQPWRVRGVEIRGRAEAITGSEPAVAHFSGELIRIHPERILSWGIDPDTPGMQRRSVTS
jgi:pyridoxamine 5'-phosphate oxidase family protein